MHITNELLMEEIPQDCIDECSKGGMDADTYVKKWQKELNFTVDKSKAIK